jgi:hypothetical protein
MIHRPHALPAAFGWFAVVACMALLVGCNPGPVERPRVPVSGTVKLDGQPLPDGEIAFIKVSEGINDVIPITNGQFSGLASVGDRKVEIRAFREERQGVEMYGDQAPVSKVNFLPEKWTTNSELTADVASGKTFEFEVTSQ